jgi:heterodisulfide reductase subunit A
LHSGYIAITDASLCNECGQCLVSCFFEARQLGIDGLHLIEDLCFGCGRCIPGCPETAIRLAYNPERGIPIPVLPP